MKKDYSIKKNHAIFFIEKPPKEQKQKQQKQLQQGYN